MGILQSLFMYMGGKNVDEEGNKEDYIKLLEDTIEEQKKTFDEQNTDIQELENILKAQNSYLSCCKSET